MRSITMVLLFCLTSSISTAQVFQTPKIVICDKTKTVITALIGSELKETPIWLGTDENSKYSLFVNEKEKTWTIIQFNDEIACVIGAGTNHTPIFLGPKI